MSIAAYTPAEFTGNGATVAFAFGFPFFAAADILVVLYDTTANALVAPQPVLNGGGTYDYTIASVADANTGEAPNGTVTFNHAPLANHRVSLRRETASTQPTSFALNGALNSKTVESSLDRQAMLAQEAGWDEGRALAAPNDDANATALALPNAAARASRVLAFDVNGNPIASDQTLAVIEAPANAVASATASAASAAAAAASAAAAANSAAAVTGTSASNVAVALGAQAFVTQAGKQWIAGQRLRVATGDASKIMEGAVASYVGTALTVTVDYTFGAGASAAWNIGVAGAVGAVGAAGAAGPAGPAGPSYTFAQFRQEQGSGTLPTDVLVNSAWGQRVLNVTKSNTIAGCLLAANQITLAAGTYQVTAYCAGSGASTPGLIQIRLRNITDATTVMVSPMASFDAPGTTLTAMQGQFTIAGAKTFELESYIASASPTGGRNLTSGEVEVYADIVITKVA